MEKNNGHELKECCAVELKRPEISDLLRQIAVNLRSTEAALINSVQMIDGNRPEPLNPIEPGYHYQALTILLELSEKVRYLSLTTEELLK